MRELSIPPPHEKREDIVLFPPDTTARTVPDFGWCALDDRGLIEVVGADAETFLQGQLTQDMARVAHGQVLLAAHCTPKGRISALFRAWWTGDGFLLELPGALAEAAKRRLGMYVLRSRVKLELAGGRWSLTALFGTQVPALFARLGIPAADVGAAVVPTDGHRCAALGGNRWLILSTREAGAILREELARRAPPDAAGYELCSVRAGEPEVYPESVEAFIPQMLNLDQIDGVSFRKGCYTGQEIVARTHYLGRVKRRLRHFAFTGPQTLTPGQSLSQDGAQVVRWVALGKAGGELLAVTAVGDESAAPDEGVPAAAATGRPGAD